MKITTLLALLALSGTSFAQKFINNSPDSPVTFTGIRLDQRWCKATAHNSDLRPVVALIADFNGTQVLHDHFFQTDSYIAMHGKDIDIHFLCSAQDVSMVVRFVQFNDGEIWNKSDPEAIAKVRATRVKATDYLNGVILAANLGPDPGVKHSADGKASITESEIWWTLKQEPNPVDAALLRISNAAEHSDWMFQLNAK